MRSVTNYQIKSIEGEWEEWKKKFCPPEFGEDNIRGLKVAFMSGALVGARITRDLVSVSSGTMVDHVAQSLTVLAQSVGGGDTPPPAAGPTIKDPDLPGN
jgi:hypothetical protein